MSLLRIAVLLGLLSPAAAQARVERYAVVIGNNRGEADEARLRYAEADAARVFDVKLLKVSQPKPATIALELSDVNLRRRLLTVQRAEWMGHRRYAQGRAESERSEFGAGSGGRTRDVQHGKLSLYH